MIFQLQNLDRSTLPHLPERCRTCGWWQGYDEGWADASSEESWSAIAEERFGCWGKLALADGRLMGQMQFGPPQLFPRSFGMPSGPAGSDSILLTCSMVADETFEPVRKSLVLSVLADLHEMEIETVEAFCRQQPLFESNCHFFDRDFLRDCGFYPARSSGSMLLMRLELGGAQRSLPRKHKARRRILERIKRPSTAPSPVTLCRRRHKDRAGACS